MGASSAIARCSSRKGVCGGWVAWVVAVVGVGRPAASPKSTPAVMKTTPSQRSGDTCSCSQKFSPAAS